MSKDNGTKVESAGGRMLAWLASATATDLAEVDQEIAAVNARIDEQLGALRGQLASLQALRRVIDLKVNGRKAGGGKGGKRREALPKGDARQKIARLLAAEGPMLATVLCSRLGVADGRSLVPVLKCEWFEATSQGYRLTTIGRREAGL